MAFNPDATWSEYQQVFTLSMLSNMASHQTGTVQSLESALKTAIDDALDNPGLQQLIGTWAIAWGPVVYQEPGSTVADNTMYVAKNQAGDTYVVAIAGTEATSILDGAEDLTVASPVPWLFGGTPAGTSPLISLGTQAGMNVLLTMTDPASGQTLAGFLAQVQSPSSTLVFTGHSLGGALAPTLALALFNGSGPLQVSDWANVSAYPTAGPTPGNADFVNFFSSVFPPSGSGAQAWNSLVWSSLDIVPHVWNTTTLEAIPNLYSSAGLPPTACVNNIVSLLSSKVASDGYTQLPSQGPLQGTFQTTLPPSYPQKLPPFSTLSLQTLLFVDQAFYQHGVGYFNLLDVDQLLPKSQDNPSGLGIFQGLTPPSTIGATLQRACTLALASTGTQGAARTAAVAG